jgi:hypothetical protein
MDIMTFNIIDCLNHRMAGIVVAYSYFIEGIATQYMDFSMNKISSLLLSSLVFTACVTDPTDELDPSVAGGGKADGTNLSIRRITTKLYSNAIESSLQGCVVTDAQALSCFAKPGNFSTVAGFESGVVEVSGAPGYVCARFDSGDVKCMVGYAKEIFDLSASLGHAESIRAFNGGVCALGDDDMIRCAMGQLVDRPHRATEPVVYDLKFGVAALRNLGPSTDFLVTDHAQVCSRPQSNAAALKCLSLSVTYNGAGDVIVGMLGGNFDTEVVETALPEEAAYITPQDMSGVLRNGDLFYFGIDAPNGEPHYVARRMVNNLTSIDTLVSLRPPYKTGRLSPTFAGMVRVIDGAGHVRAFETDDTKLLGPYKVNGDSYSVDYVKMMTGLATIDHVVDFQWPIIRTRQNKVYYAVSDQSVAYPVSGL